MFVQVIRGRVSEPARVRTALDQWMQELAAGADGWLGTTAGVTEDGTCIALARFETEEAARRNSERPEQGRWWAETAKLFSEEPTFRDSSRVDVDVSGDPDRAGFVQVIQGRTSDPDRARELMTQGSSADWTSFRPDIIGSLSIEHDGGDYTTALYFSSEEEAREGERKEPPAEMKAVMEEMDSLSAGETTFYDLRQPWLFSR